MSEPSITNWIQLLYGYAPVIENRGQTTEKVGKLEKSTGITRIQFDHPARKHVTSALVSRTNPKNILLLGTAGDGKTSLMYDGKAVVAPNSPVASGKIETFNATLEGAERTFTFIYDVSAWRKGGNTPEERTAILERLAASVAGKLEEIFVIAANDGALHQVFQHDLPEAVSSDLANLRDLINTLHAGSQTVSTDAPEPARLRLINLSLISSEEIMKKCLGAVLDRPEWKLAGFGTGAGMLSPDSPLVRNHTLMNSPHVRERIVTIAKLSDACGFHLSIRDILCLIVNTLLGHPDANQGVLKPGAGSDALVVKYPRNAPLALNFFGDQLTNSMRRSRKCYEFLSLLQIGGETTNELDDLLIFGSFDQEDETVKSLYDQFVAPDPLSQRNPNLSAQIDQYVRDDVDDVESLKLRRALAGERRRLFLTGTTEAFDKLDLWKCTSFHHAGTYLTSLLDPVRNYQAPDSGLVRKIVAGLNRIWTGFLLNEKSSTLYLCTGLDITTAPVSDLLVRTIEIDGMNGDSIRIDLDPISRLPLLSINAPNQPSIFTLPLTLQRFEFLMRVAEGAMPTSFSKESTEDFSIQKQNCLRNIQADRPTTLFKANVDESGDIKHSAITVRFATKTITAANV